MGCDLFDLRNLRVVRCLRSDLQRLISLDHARRGAQRILTRGVDQDWGVGCDIFLTRDYRTTWRFRDRLSRFGLSVLRPIEPTRAMNLR